MAIFEIKTEGKHSKVLAVAPDFVIGDNIDYCFMATSSTHGNMDVWLYNEESIKKIIEYLDRKNFDKFEASLFKDIFFKIYNLFNGVGDKDKLFSIKLDDFTYFLNSFKTDNIIAKKLNYFLPMSDSHKTKQRILYILITIQHVICEQISKKHLKMQTVSKL